MKGRTPTIGERAYMDKAMALGCIVCRTQHTYTPANIHHIDGKTKPGVHFNVLALCPPHHQYKGPEWISRHGDGRKAFEKEYGSEQALLAYQNNLLGLGE